MLSYKEPRARWHRQEELYSWGAELRLYRRLCLGTVTNIIGTFVFRQDIVCTDVLFTRVQVVLVLSHHSLNLNKLIWLSSSTFQHHQLSSAETSAPTFAANFECASMIGFGSRFFSTARSSAVFVERRRSLEQQSASAADCLLGNKSELGHLNDGTTTVRVSHYTQCIAA